MGKRAPARCAERRYLRCHVVGCGVLTRRSYTTRQASHARSACRNIQAAFDRTACKRPVGCSETDDAMVAPEPGRTRHLHLVGGNPELILPWWRKPCHDL